MLKAKFQDGVYKYHKMIGDSWKHLIGYKMQDMEPQPGYCKISFTKQVENVLLGCNVIQWDDGHTEVSEEYVAEILEDY